MGSLDSEFLSGLNIPDNNGQNELAPPEEMAPQQDTQEVGDLSFDSEDNQQGGIQQGYVPDDDFRGFNTDVDIVFVIDATGSMTPFLERVKNEALYFMQGLEVALAEKKRVVRQVRLKVIAFRDIYYDDVHLMESPFFLMPSQQQEYANFVAGLEASGGGDAPENSLEALALAIRSRWSTDNAVQKRRQIIALFTDTIPHPLDSPKRYDSAVNHKYPSLLDDIKSLDDLQMEWMNPQTISASGKRLALFAPDAEPWNTIKTWDLVVPGAPLQANMGAEEASMNLVYQFIANSV